MFKAALPYLGKELYSEAPLLRMLVAYEIISILFATHPFNHFSWAAGAPASVEDFYSDRAKRIGAFYSALVALLLQGRFKRAVQSKVDPTLINRQVPWNVLRRREFRKV